jgi:nucleotide-binding universal stress UspA family protein
LLVACAASIEPVATDASHTLVVYGPSARADDVLRELADSRVTVLSLVPQESEDAGCCDTRSVLWNEISRDLGREALARARLALDDRDAVRLEVVHFSGRHAADAIVREVLDRDADAVVLANAPLGRLARRRLRRLSPVPVRDALL